MLRLLRKGRVEWRAEIPESRMREIGIGQSVKLTTADGTQLEGKVRAIAPTIESSTRAGLVYVDIPSDRRRASRHVRARRNSARSERGEHGAARERRDPGRLQLRVRRQGDQQRSSAGASRPAPCSGEQIEIVSGVQPGERIVDKGAGFLKDGDRVQRRAGRRPTAETSRVMNFVTWSIRNPVPVIVLFVALTVAGLLSFREARRAGSARHRAARGHRDGRAIPACRRRSSNPKSRARSRTRSRPSPASSTFSSTVNEGVSTTSIEFQLRARHQRSRRRRARRGDRASAPICPPMRASPSSRA